MKNFDKAVVAALVAISSMTAAQAQVRITEWMYNPANSVGEYVEFTNLGSTAVDFGTLSFSFDDSSRTAGSTSLSAFGIVQAGESVVFTEAAETVFRSNWALSSAVKVIGGNTNNLGRSDEINLYSGETLLDRLTYNDQGSGSVKGPRTLGTSGRPGSFAAIGANDAAKWVLSSVGDVERSYRSVGVSTDIGSPGYTSFAAPVPEPETYAMLLAGLGLMGAVARRKRTA